MAGARDDYLLRLIKDAAAALRHMRERLGSGAVADDIVRDADTAIGTLLGPQRALLERLDAWSAANLLGDPERVWLWSQLLTLQADVMESENNVSRSAALRSRAAGLSAHVPPNLGTDRAP